MDKPNLDFGTDILRDDISKLIDICVAVNGGKLSDDKYTTKRAAFAATTGDRAIVEFFNDKLGTKRRATTFLVSSGLIKMYSDLANYPTSMFQMEQVLAAIAYTDDVDYILLDDNKLKLSLPSYDVIKGYHVEIPLEVWGMICSIGRGLRVHPVYIIMCLIRMGVFEYNDFVKSFSSQIKIRSWMLKYSKKSSDTFLHNIKRLYKQRLNLIIDLYDECESKKPYSEEIKELIFEMEQIKKENNI